MVHIRAGSRVDRVRVGFGATFWRFFTFGSFGSGTNKPGLGKKLEIGSGIIGSGSGLLLRVFLLSGRPDPVDPTSSSVVQLDTFIGTQSQLYT